MEIRKMYRTDLWPVEAAHLIPECLALCKSQCPLECCAVLWWEYTHLQHECFLEARTRRVFEAERIAFAGKPEVSRCRKPSFSRITWYIGEREKPSMAESDIARAVSDQRGNGMDHVHYRRNFTKNSLPESRLQITKEVWCLRCWARDSISPQKFNLTIWSGSTKFVGLETKNSPGRPDLQQVVAHGRLWEGSGGESRSWSYSVVEHVD
jgi:hypothetical protein